ncbi:MAG: elongation factor P [Chloroflexi bacterium]|nr:elongation factor P [Chloroflexota bacterium]
MTISSSEIRRNMTIILDDEVYQILEWQHRQAPKAPPTLTLKVRQVKSGNVYERKLAGNQKLTRAAVDTPTVQYLYPDGDMHNFMDTETFDQFAIAEEVLGDALKYISEGDTIEIMMYEGVPLSVEVPPSVTLEIGQTEVGLRGDTQSGATKPATTTTGLVLQVPLFVSTGDRIVVNSTTGEYTGRAD